MRIRIVFFACFLLSGCAYMKKVRGPDKTPQVIKAIQSYSFEDKSGKFNLVRESGKKPGTNHLIVKRSIYSGDKPNQALLEKSISIAEQGTLKDKVRVLRPLISQFYVWFDGKEYFSEIKVDMVKKGLFLKLESPEKQWNKSEFITFPKGTGVYCFFSQLIECIKETGFFETATKKEVGQIAFHLIFDGYPYFQEQYLDVPDQIFSAAQMSYDGKNERGERRFSLIFGEQSIFFFLDQADNFYKMFWVSQGLSITPFDE